MFTIDEKALKAIMLQEGNRALIEAAEPIVQQAMKDIERRLREKLASIAISLIETDIDLMRDGKNIKIMIRHKEAQ